MASIKKTVKKSARKPSAKSTTKKASAKSGVFWPMKGEELVVFKLFYPKGPTQDLYRTLFEDLFIRAQKRLTELKAELATLEGSLGGSKDQKRLAEIQGRKRVLELKLELMSLEEEMRKNEDGDKQKLMGEIKTKKSNLAALKGKHPGSSASKTAQAKMLSELEVLSIFLHGK